MRMVLALAALFLTSGSAAAQRKGGRCTGEPADTTVLSAAPVFRDCEVDRAARVRTDIRPIFRPGTTGPESRCYRTELEFVVDTTGRPEPGDIRVVSSNSPELTQAVRLAVPALRYDPAVRDGAPVRQRVRYKSSVAVKVVVSRGGEQPDPGRRPLC